MNGLTLEREASLCCDLFLPNFEFLLLRNTKVGLSAAPWCRGEHRQAPVLECLKLGVSRALLQAKNRRLHQQADTNTYRRSFSPSTTLSFRIVAMLPGFLSRSSSSRLTRHFVKNSMLVGIAFHVQQAKCSKSFASSINTSKPRCCRTPRPWRLSYGNWRRWRSVVIGVAHRQASRIVTLP
ncbi:hypothetical protein BC835DRAFT_248477 [Cytidiella melzeri]|nr:hypothetical protein BC835DRAFT_248477 [Cytidiella melzeri]